MTSWYSNKYFKTTNPIINLIRVDFIGECTNNKAVNNNQNSAIQNSQFRQPHYTVYIMSL